MKTSALVSNRFVLIHACVWVRGRGGWSEVKSNLFVLGVSQVYKILTKHKLYHDYPFCRVSKVTFGSMFR